MSVEFRGDECGNVATRQTGTNNFSRRIVWIICMSRDDTKMEDEDKARISRRDRVCKIWIRGWVISELVADFLRDRHEHS